MEVECIVEQFFGDDGYKISPITNGLINSTFSVENLDTRKKFILQKINKQVLKNPNSLILNHLHINYLLESSGYLYEIVNLVPSIKKEYLVYDENFDPWRMLSYIEDSVTFSKVSNAAIAYEAAKTFSHFLAQINSKELPSLEEIIPDFINFEKRMHDYKAALENANEELKIKAKKEIQIVNLFENLPLKWIELVKENQLPKRVIHADPKISNILFNKNNEALAVIDLDTLMISTILYDFGDMVRSYCNTKNEDEATTSNNFNSEIYKSVKNGFHFHLKDNLSTIELENLDYAAKVVVYIQAVRFLTDYLNGSTYYSIQYPEHNLDRTQNQLQLLKSMSQYLD